MPGPLIIDLLGFEVSSDEAKILSHPLIGGVVLFRRNFQNPNQLHNLIVQIRRIIPNGLVTVDHEGGSVWRFDEGFTKLPPMRTFGEHYDRDPEEALAAAQQAGYVLAQELRRYDIDLSFTPVLDLDYGKSQVIKDRAFHRDPTIVIDLAKALIQGMQKAGMKATGKHFPGHGGCELDSHLDSVIDERNIDQLMVADLIPFQALKNDLGAIMTAHVTYPRIDTVPASFSQRWLTTLLREKMGFQGAIISDCLSMKAATIENSLTARIQRALSAGCDAVILCQQPREVLTTLLSNSRIIQNPKSGQRLSALRKK